MLPRRKQNLMRQNHLQAKVEVKGKGNLKLFDLPKISLPSSLEVYEPEHNENVRTNLDGMQGSISDTYTVVPQYKGKYPTPSISFSYFDLKTKTYKRLNSNEMVINVLEGPSSAGSSKDNIVSNNTKQPVVLSSDQFAFIKTKSNFQRYYTILLFSNEVVLGFLVVAILNDPISYIY